MIVMKSRSSFPQSNDETNAEYGHMHAVRSGLDWSYGASTWREGNSNETSGWHVILSSNFMLFSVSSRFAQKLTLLEPYITLQDTKYRLATPSKVRLMAFLYHVSQGANYRSVSNQFGIRISNVSKCVHDVTFAILRHMYTDLRMNRANRDWVLLGLVSGYRLLISVRSRGARGCSVSISVRPSRVGLCSVRFVLLGITMYKHKP